MGSRKVRHYKRYEFRKVLYNQLVSSGNCQARGSDTIHHIDEGFSMQCFFLSDGGLQSAMTGLAWVAVLLLSGPCAYADPTPQSPKVVVVAVQFQPVGQVLEWDGVVQPVKQSTISAQTSGRIVGLSVKAGDAVRAGQVLATIDDRETQSSVLRSQAQVAQAQADLHNAQASFNRTRDLRHQGFISAAALDTAQAQLQSAKAGHDQASAGAKQSSLQQGFTRVTAPFDALVLQTQSEAGDLAVPGKPLLTLYAPKPLRVVVQVPVSRAQQMLPDSVVELEMPAVKGVHSWICPTSRTLVPSADSVSQTIEWRLDLPTSAQTLLPGQQVRVRFEAAPMQRMVIPQQAVLQRGELTAVYVAAAQGFVLKAVRLGVEHAQGVEVLAGLSPSDRVAIEPIKAGLTSASVLVGN
jgi:RND family efflux transporter MFP subunit